MAALFIAAIALGTARRQATPLQPFSLPFGVSATLPAKPEEDKEGDKGSNRKSFISSSEDTVFFVTDLPLDSKENAALTPDQEIGVYVLGALQSLEGSKLSSYSDVLLDGWPGVEIKVDDAKDGEQIWSRVYNMNGQIVEVGAIYKADPGPASSVLTVLNSLKQDKPKYGHLASAGIGFSNLEPDGMGFHVDFPEDVKDAPEDVDMEGGVKMTLHHYDYSRDMRLFDLGYLQLPAAATDGMPEDGPQQIREQAMTALLKGFDAEMDSSTTEQRDGNDWLTVQFHVKNFAVGRADVLFLDGRIYTLIAFGPEPWQDAPEFKRFF